MEKNIRLKLMHVLKPLYGEWEARNIAKYLIPEMVYYSREQFEDALSRLAMHEPWQYIIETEWFYELELKVTPATLIPRPETEELVHYILQNHSERNLKVLDIGTGSGCIALALQRHRPHWSISGCDISEQALAIAKENASHLGLEVNFFKYDILNASILNEKWDIIISNPPYIPENEQRLMRENVLQYEPHLALFVPDQDPLLFYRKIAEFAKSHLFQSGNLYFELNEFYAEETLSLIQSMQYKEAHILNDLMDKPRMISAQL